MDHRQTTYDTAQIDKLRDRLNRPVVLVGMMGVGKSSVGKRLAALLHFDFADADDEIELAAKMTIPEIFATHGEPYFRDGERRVIARMLTESGSSKVIATGGGAFCNAETRQLILDKAVAIWLDSDVDTLVQRTARKTHRPLLQQGNPREVLERLRDERRPDYAQAPIHVISRDGPHSETLANILKGLDEWL